MVFCRNRYLRVSYQERVAGTCGRHAYQEGLPMKAFFEEEGRLKKFLGKDGNICREERQFALFLYLVFLKKKREETRGENGGYIEKTVRKCLALEDSQDIEIIDVYYEVSMMRDYWNYFKKDKKGGGFAISEKVLHFCLDFQRGAAEASEVVDQLLSKNQNLRSNYLGQNLWQEAVREHYGVGDLFERERDSITDEEKRKMRIKAGLDIAKMMMNATPDILVVYKLNDRLYAKAIECKYKSKAGKYRDIAGVKSRMQLFIQECIMCFCFGTNEYTDEQNGIFHIRQKVLYGKNQRRKFMGGDMPLGL